MQLKEVDIEEHAGRVEIIYTHIYCLQETTTDIKSSSVSQIKRNENCSLGRRL